MNDRYLFRAKHSLESKKWNIGNLVEEPDGLYLRDNKKNIMVYIQDHSTICQCTGLKDKNGKLIWENDIMKYQLDGKTRIYVVKYEPPMFSYKNVIRCSLYQDEVIGNIFDNPELLESED